VEALAVTIAGVTLYLVDSSRDKVLRRALVAVQIIPSKWKRADALAKLAPHLRNRKEVRFWRWPWRQYGKLGASQNEHRLW